MIQVTMLDAMELATYTIRSFTLYKVKLHLPLILSVTLNRKMQPEAFVSF